jgi:M6 family metalloprotease-like protein
MRIVLITLIAVLFTPQSAFSDKINLKKIQSNLEELRIHPVMEHFAKNYPKRLEKIQAARSQNFQNLLVLLIDFQEDDNPQTTGNGKFILDGSDYEIPFGKPPHNYEFFSAHMEALRYYYQAVSFGQFDLFYDIYPKPTQNQEFNTYTLPQEMAYYNQLDASPEIMIARFEEYFTNALTTADNDPEIDFSKYEHVMFIHAGSDWQHDVLGDTPKDMPSFFIQIGEGKEFVTSQGIIIDSACNVPSMITQDIRQVGNDFYGYGLINAVIAHEFGHSLGFVDLYNVKTFRPAVGYYDIMDSGGSGYFAYSQFSEIDEIEKYYMIEGGVPTLPGVWSRLLVPQWKEYFEEMGFLRSVEDLLLDTSITLQPSSQKPTFITNNPYFIKVPLSNDEYILIENRQVDPNGDGGTSFVGTLPVTPNSTDYRVLLYPSSLLPGDSSPNYEYDFFLPGWFTTDGSALGGGLLVWHIDDKIIYQNDNFSNNSVNTVYSKRGVRIIEADNIQDIGNPYSYFWLGTAYEPYFKYMPKINKQGFFTGWDDQHYSNPDGALVFLGHYHNQELSATSKPSLKTNSGYESFYKLYDISSYPIANNQYRHMSFKIGSTFFDKSEIITEIDFLQTISNIANSNFFHPEGTEFLAIEQDEIKLLNHVYSNPVDEWLERTFNYQFVPTQEIVTFDFDGNGSEDYFITHDKTLTILNNYGNILLEQIFPETITEAPFYIPEKDLLVISTTENIHLNNTSFSFSKAKYSFNGSCLFVVSEEKTALIDANELTFSQTFILPNSTSLFKPIAYRDIESPNLSAFFVQTDNGDVIKINETGWNVIFSTNDYTLSTSSQLALHYDAERMQAYLVFGAGNSIFKIDIFGNLSAGFPMKIDNGKIKSYDFPKTVILQNQICHFMTLDNEFNFAFDHSGKPLPHYSYYWMNEHFPSYLHWERDSSRLYFIYAKKGETKTQLYSSYLNTSNMQSPILWNGFRHNKYGLVEGIIRDSITETHFSTYVFPNPAKGKQVRIKVKNALTDIELKIYDVAGNRVYSKIYSKNPTSEQDLYWNISQLSSGVYFGIVKSGSKQNNIKIAIEK